MSIHFDRIDISYYKRLIMTSLFICLICLICSCSPEKTIVQDLQYLQDDITENAQYYTDDDWESAQICIDRIERDFKKHRSSFTVEEQQAINEQIGRCKAYIVGKKTIDTFNEISDFFMQVKGGIDLIKEQYDEEKDDSSQ